VRAARGRPDLRLPRLRDIRDEPFDETSYVEDLVF